MTHHVRTELLAGADRPILRKVPVDDEGAAELEREGDRLSRARHPGVVAVVSHLPDRLDLDWAGAVTLDRAGLGPTELVGLIGSVAATVAELHRRGIVHGRIHADHVLLDGTGRGRLGGFGGAIPTATAAPTPADDVADVGRLLDLVLAAEPPAGSGRQRGATRSGPDLGATRTIRDHATHDDPARRPTARVLAVTLARVVEPTPYPEAPAASATVDEDPAVDNDARTPADGPTPEERSPIERWRDHGLDPDARPDTTPIRSVTGAGRADRAESSGPIDIDGARTPVGASTAPPRVRHRHLAAGAAAAAVVIGLIGWRQPARPDSRPVKAGEPPASREIVESTATPVSPCSGPTVIGPDIDGDGCGDAVRVDGTRVEIDGTSFQVGRAGDRVTVGDWDCDGTATPGLVRPTTGEVFLFDHWAADRPVALDRPTRAVAGAATLVPSPPGDACAPPRLRLDDGSVRALSGTTP